MSKPTYLYMYGTIVLYSYSSSRRTSLVVHDHLASAVLDAARVPRLAATHHHVAAVWRVRAHHGSHTGHTGQRRPHARLSGPMCARTVGRTTREKRSEYEIDMSMKMPTCETEGRHARGPQAEDHRDSHADDPRANGMERDRMRRVAGGMRGGHGPSKREA